MTDGNANRPREEAPLPAKLVRPRLHRAWRRQRPMALLEGLLAHSAVWIGGAPGSGKTVLASTCAESRKRPCVWYRLDARDRYPATLFHYLRNAALAIAPQAASDLTPLTSEYLAGLDTYARNFFERFFALLKSGTVLVFDNCQELGDDSPPASLLAAGVAQAPESVRIILTSREPPGAAFTRLLAGESLRVFDAAELALDAEEARAIARQRFGKNIAPEQVDEIHRQTRGWAAGFTLLLEQTGAQRRIPALATEHLSDYFSAEVLSGIESETLETLMQGAWLPRMPAALLNRQCEDTQATERIDTLCRRNYFISRTSGDEPVYEYHPLFRDGLLRRAREHWPAERLDAVRRRAAALMSADGQSEDALHLLLDLCDWTKIAELIQAQAPTWFADGRTQIVGSALQAMPEEEIAKRPWLRYWQASCRLSFDLDAARELFARANDAFRVRDDYVGQLYACAAVLESYFHERGDFHPLDRWIATIEALLEAHPGVLNDPQLEARLTTALFSAFMARHPDHPAFAQWIARAEWLMMHTRDELLKLGLATHLVAYYAWWAGDGARACAIVDAIEPARHDAHTNPLNHIVWNGGVAILRWTVLDFAGCIEAGERGLRIAAASGIHLWDFLLLAQCSWGAIFAGDEPGAEAFLQRMAAALRPGCHLDASHYHFQRFILAMRRNDAAAMTAEADAGWQYAEAAGDPWAEGLLLVARARADAANGDVSAALRLLRKAETQVKGEAGNTIKYAVLLTRAELAFDADDPAAGVPELRRLMQFACRKNCIYSNWERDEVMPKLCVRALEHDIETGFVRRLIRLRQLVPCEPPLHLDDWPWPLDIVTLGRFEVRLDGEPLRFERKSQKRPLALLKALIALGGRDVPETRLADALWPEAEGDAAQQALATTLHRLRRLIGANAVRRREGLLGLDRARCRVDLWTCERHLAQVENALPEDTDTACAALCSALALYRGPFLDGDEEAAWALPARERLRNRLLRTVIATADALHADGQPAESIACYERGLALDELAEECYRGLMRCHLDNGHCAEGLAVYRRCAEALQRMLGVTPGADTEALRRAIAHR